MLDLLFFECNGYRYTVNATEVESVAWLPELSPLDGVPQWVAGHLNWHGVPVPVVDLGRLLGHAPQPRSLADQLIVLNTPDGQVAVLVSRVDQLLTLPETVVASENSVERRAGLPFKAELRDGDRLVMVLDVDVLGQRVSQTAMPQPEASNPESALTPTDETPETAKRFLARMHQLAEARSEYRGADRSTYALVRIGERRYAIPLTVVAEFARLQHYAVLPGLPSFIVGCMNLRGEILSIVDLDQLLHSSQPARGQEVVVITLAGKRLAIRIIDVERMIDADPTAIQLMAETDEQHPLSRQLLHLPDMIVAVLDADALLKGSVLDVFEQV